MPPAHCSPARNLNGDHLPSINFPNRCGPPAQTREEIVARRFVNYLRKRTPVAVSSLHLQVQSQTDGEARFFLG